MYAMFPSLHALSSIIKSQGLMLLSDGSLRDWFRRLPVYRGIL